MKRENKIKSIVNDLDTHNIPNSSDAIIWVFHLP